MKCGTVPVWYSYHWWLVTVITVGHLLGFVIGMSSLPSVEYDCSHLPYIFQALAGLSFISYLFRPKSQSCSQMPGGGWAPESHWSSDDLPPLFLLSSCGVTAEIRSYVAVAHCHDNALISLELCGRLSPLGPSMNGSYFSLHCPAWPCDLLWPVRWI